MSNQTHAGAVIAGTIGGASAIGGAYFVVSDNKAGRLEIHAHIQGSHAALNRKIDLAYAKINYQFVVTQSVLVSSAINTAKGFDGDKRAMKNFVTQVEKWAKECKETGNCGVIEAS
ncbi:hypothetical protein B9Z19DRAFT_1093975 [Tuber borchii]|uniref:Uncharacterized protein n=1 Tax=Tuber borchii TaxID=42251 RepID=A0A2T6ZEZ9_TUBBO|nr:hypothetical protein B9Z19DRAFT_1093975 [Tuber borchii]